MADYENIISEISSAVEEFGNKAGMLENDMLQEIQSLTQELETNDGTLRVSINNIRLVSQIRNKLDKIIISSAYKKEIKRMLSSFDKITTLQRDYFSKVESKFKEPSIAKAIRDQAITSVTSRLLEKGISGQISNSVFDLLRSATTSGAKYSTLTKKLESFFKPVDSSGPLKQYSAQVANDALTQYSGTYSQLLSADLGFEWFRYSGNNIDTTRPICRACKERQWFHISEIPKMLKGDFIEFREVEGKINPKTKLPYGMIEGTDVTNFQINRGGYNCGHLWRPGSEDIVPQQFKDRVYASKEYKYWAKVNGKG